MGQRLTPKTRRYPTLIKEYEKHLRLRVQEGEIKEITLRTYLNGANRVLESLLAGLTYYQIEAIVARRYKNNDGYKDITRQLKDIMEHRTF